MSTSSATPPRRGGAHFASDSTDDAADQSQNEVAKNPQDAQPEQTAQSSQAPQYSQVSSGRRDIPDPIPFVDDDDEQTSSAYADLPSVGATAPRPIRPTSSAASARLADRAADGQEGSYQPYERRDQRKKTPIFAVVLVIILVVVVIVAIVGFSSLGEEETEEESNLVEEGTAVTITIEEGAGASAIADILYEAGLISDTSEFLAQVRRTGAESSLQCGTYSITAGASYSTIIDLLCDGPNVSTDTLTVPEGYTVAQVAELVEEEFGISADAFIEQAKASNYVSDYEFLEDVNDDSLEGYLFPKTYDFTGQDITADLIIRTMLDQYEVEVADLDLESCAETLSERYGVEITVHDIITMASIVEREALTDEQRPIIASVFYNRLSIGMYLQSDATLAYSLGTEVTSDDLSIDDPYNTYLYEGLTPTPICSPGLASIEAAANPDDTDYYYFYILEDYEVFSETYEQHLEAIANAPS